MVDCDPNTDSVSAGASNEATDVTNTANQNELRLELLLSLSLFLYVCLYYYFFSDPISLAYDTSKNNTAHDLSVKPRQAFSTHFV